MTTCAFARKPLAMLLALALAFTGVCLPEHAFAASDGKKARATEVSLVAVGDNLIHSQVYKAAKKSTGGYDFSSLFAHVKKDIKAADIAVINQETIFIDKHPSGYPTFGTPKKAMARAIVAAGFDVVQHATNHTMDRGAGAVRGTLKYWHAKYPQIKVLGIHSSAQAAHKITVMKKNGIKIALLNYTYGLNGLEGRVRTTPYLVDLLRANRVKADIKRAKKQADFVVVFTHMGTEYTYKPDAYSRAWAKRLADWGADLMIGTHPHVVEPVRWVKGKGGHKMLAYYSLGNFVSAQKARDRMLGAMASVTIVKDKKGTRIKSHEIIPLITHVSKGWRSFTVYKLSDYTPALARAHSLGTISVGGMKALFKKITGHHA